MPRIPRLTLSVIYFNGGKSIPKTHLTPASQCSWGSCRGRVLATPLKDGLSTEIIWSGQELLRLQLVFVVAVFCFRRLHSLPATHLAVTAEGGA